MFDVVVLKCGDHGVLVLKFLTKLQMCVYVLSWKIIELFEICDLFVFLDNAMWVFGMNNFGGRCNVYEGL